MREQSTSERMVQTEDQIEKFSTDPLRLFSRPNPIAVRHVSVERIYSFTGAKEVLARFMDFRQISGEEVKQSI